MKIRNEKLKKELDEAKESITINLDSYEILGDLCCNNECETCPFKDIAFREDLTCVEVFIYKKYNTWFENEGMISYIVNNILSEEISDINTYCLKTSCKNCILANMINCTDFIMSVKELDYDLERKVFLEEDKYKLLEDKMNKILEMLDKLVK